MEVLIIKNVNKNTKNNEINNKNKYNYNVHKEKNE